ncbi:3-4-dihydroxy 2-butanone 4-phosphate synthase [Penicillium sp. IBT 35674x]|nr:3-4-dihydroxy 2-butanone 4-phosphate synthase [Penicillium sp. IBT 35674x]
MSDLELQFNTIEEAVNDIRIGEFVIVVDSQDRENEGDLIIAADSITEAKMAFMVRYTSGLICAPILPDLADHLNLSPMVAENTDPNRTAYTITIDAEDPSVTTGISAHDRSLTCRALAHPTVQPNDFRRPGHIIPLRAREGGVRERSGHTEAAIDLCRLAGKAEVGVIAELVPEGTEAEGVAERYEEGMMRRKGCLTFGKKWGLKVISIEDLVRQIEVL